MTSDLQSIRIVDSARMMLLNKENTSADLNSAKSTDSNSSEPGIILSHSPRTTTNGGLGIVGGAATSTSSASSSPTASPKSSSLLLSQHLLELNQMRPHSHPHSSPPYKFFQDNSSSFYQTRPLLNGADLTEFKLNVQLKEKQQPPAPSETSEEVVVDGNDDVAEDSSSQPQNHNNNHNNPVSADQVCPEKQKCCDLSISQVLPVDLTRTTTTTTPRKLAFSVENILDPTKFTGRKEGGGGGCDNFDRNNNHQTSKYTMNGSFSSAGGGGGEMGLRNDEESSQTGE